MKHLHELAVVCVCAALAAVLAASAAPQLLAAPFSGCRGDYYNNRTADGRIVFSRMDPAINFHWPEGFSPDPAINPTNFSVRWTCVVEIPTAGDYTFTYSTDDGMNILIDGAAIIWDFLDQGASVEEPRTVYLTAGRHTINVEYYNAGGPGTAKVNATIPGWNEVPELQCASNCTIRTDTPMVYYGDPSYLIALAQDKWADLTAEDAISTDINGEAWVNLGIDGCQSVYVFRDTKLQFSPCDKSDRTGGNISCLEEGTARFWDRCPGSLKVVQTPDGDVVLQGTYAEVSYQPGSHLTMVAVLEGTVQVRRKLDTSKRTLDQPVQVEPEHYWYGIPENVPVTDIAKTKTGRLSEMPPAVLQATFLPVMDRLVAHAVQDRVDLSTTFVDTVLALPKATPTPTPVRSPTPTPTATKGALRVNPTVRFRPVFVPTATSAAVFKVNPTILYAAFPTRTPTQVFKAYSVLANPVFLRSAMSQLPAVMQKNLVFAPAQLSPADSADLTPVTVAGVVRRWPTLTWATVSDAKSYTVEIDPYGVCRANLWCNDVGQTWSVVTDIWNNEYRFVYPEGAQEVRWRVKAMLSDGSTPWSGWWTFGYSR